MGIYHQDIEDILLNCPVKDNILHDYDNYTYHIQLFMVPSDILSKYELLMSKQNSNYKEAEELLINNKYIIAESGVTNGTYIDSLSMDTVPPTYYDNNRLSTIKFDLRLEEVSGCSLVNKISLCSKICGYKAYVQQKYFISIWFTGYNNKNYNKNNIENNIGNIKYTYEVTIADVKTKMESNKTSYLMEMYPQFFPSINTNFNRLLMCDKIIIGENSSLEFSIKQLEYNLNTQLKKLLGNKIYKNIYGETDAYKLIVVKPKSLDKNHTEIFSYEDYENGGFIERKEYVDPNIEMQSRYNSSVKKPAFVIKSTLPSKEEKERVENIRSMYDYGTFKLTKDYGPIAKNFDQVTGVLLTPDENDTLQTILEKIFYLYDDLGKNGFNFILENRTVFKKSYNGINWYETYVYINIVEVPGLKRMNEALANNNYEYFLYAPLKYQKEYLDVLFKTNSSNIKRYYWLLNNKNIDVLSIKKDEDQLWYLNSSYNNNRDINENNTDDNDEPNNDNVNETNNIDILLNSLKNKNSNKNIYVDDLYNLFLHNRELYKLNLDNLYSFGVTCSLLDFYKNESSSINKDTSEKTKDDISAEINKEINVSSLGYRNLFETGQKLNIDMDIIGDPYWLLYNSENIQINNLPYMLPHIVLCMKSYYQTDGMDNYTEDKLMEINTLYIITEIKSIFQNGTFIQKLKGYVATPFIKASNNSSIEEEEKYINEHFNKQKKLDEYLVEDAYGRGIIVKEKDLKNFNYKKFSDKVDNITGRKIILGI